MSYFTLDKLHERPSPIVYRHVWMSPALAAEILEKNNTRNRKRKDRFIRRLARAIQAGNWQSSNHQGIAFSPDGILLDGQNRLNAVVAAAMPVLIAVAYNVPDGAQAYMDNGSIRNEAERQKFGFGVDVDTKDVSIAKTMIGRGRDVDISETDLNAFLNDHMEVIRFARSSFPDRAKGSRAGMYAAVARAYYHVPATRLVRFCTVMNQPQPFEPNEQAAAKWGTELMNMTQKTRSPDIFDRTQRALASFLRGETKGIIKPETRNIFPLPGEDEGDALVIPTTPPPCGPFQLNQAM